MINRTGQSLFDGSGRIEGYISGIKVFLDHMMMGLGPGTSNYKNQVGRAIPHNMIIQFLAQFGIIGSFILFLGFIPTVRRIIMNNNIPKWAFITIIIGSMFIPDIISSHYFTVVTLLSLCCLYNEVKKEE